MRGLGWSRLGRRGIAAVEFALVAPALLVLMIGTAEMLLLYRTEAKLNQMAGNVAQMVSDQASPVSAGPAGTIGDICKAANDGLQPFPPSGLSLAVASVTETAAAGTKNGAPTPATYDVWENDDACANAATQLTAATAQAIATGNGTAANSMLIATGDNAIIVRATLAYPGITTLFLGNVGTLTQTAFARWRSTTTATELKCTGASCKCSAATACS